MKIKYDVLSKIGNVIRAVELDTAKDAKAIETLCSFMNCDQPSEIKPGRRVDELGIIITEVEK